MGEAEEERNKKPIKVENTVFYTYRGVINWWKRLRCASCFLDVCSSTCSRTVGGDVQDADK